MAQQEGSPNTNYLNWGVRKREKSAFFFYILPSSLFNIKRNFNHQPSATIKHSGILFGLADWCRVKGTPWDHLVQPHGQSRASFKAVSYYLRPCPAEFGELPRLVIPQLRRATSSHSSTPRKNFFPHLHLGLTEAPIWPLPLVLPEDFWEEPDCLLYHTP